MNALLSITALEGILGMVLLVVGLWTYSDMKKAESKGPRVSDDGNGNTGSH